MGLIQEDTFPRLVGDVGGTNARFAWLTGAGSTLTDIDTLPCAAFPSLIDAIRHYLGKHAKPPPRWCAIGIANPVVGDHVQMTNHDWSFSISAVQAQLGLTRFLVINDFTALALSLPVLAAADVRQVGGGQPVAGAPLGLIGPGTGLGVSGLLPEMSGHGAIPINGEGGHVTLAATSEHEERVIAVLRTRFGHASAERAVSGPGLVNLHAALCELAGEAAPPLTPQEITERALSGVDARCTEAVEMFFSFLGTVAGNLALSLGARGGMYIGGGVVPRLGEQIDRSRFRESFECKGRFRAYLQEIPTYVVQASMSPALIGAARALEDL
ncbi:glucokinase [Piscinibacter sp.]|jgi:glucokinase|uniref:glucokinase n=1 Tax=Piscinibacter sp. TaxID=1903157 RepID=UPI0035599C26